MKSKFSNKFGFLLLPVKLSKKYLNHLGKKWDLGPVDLAIVFLVFSATGFSLTLLRPYVNSYIFDHLQHRLHPINLFFLKIFLFSFCYYVLLLILGSLVGKSKFFYSMAKRPVQRMSFLFRIIFKTIVISKDILLNWKMLFFDWNKPRNWTSRKINRTKEIDRVRIINERNQQP